jgi:hypothetical protein
VVVDLDGELHSHGYAPTKGRKRLRMSSIAWWPTLIVLAIATFTDLRSRRIPNWLVLPFMILGIGVSGWLHGWRGIGNYVQPSVPGLAQSSCCLHWLSRALRGASWLSAGPRPAGFSATCFRAQVIWSSVSESADCVLTQSWYLAIL